MRRCAFVAILVGFSTSVGLAQSPGPAPTPTAAAVQEPAVATFGGQAITAPQLEEAAGARLLRVRNEEYQLKADIVRNMAFERLQNEAASKLGITRPELYRLNVTAKAGEPAKEQVDELLQRYRSQLPQDEAQAREEVSKFLREQRTREQEQAWRRKLLADADFKLLVEPPRAALVVGAADVVRGPAGAPVTLVEFSDFQCPFCGRIQPTVQRVRQSYGDKVRMVFKQLPLAMHQQARFAAEAALCAGQQGRFWELHDWMFSNQAKLAPEAIKAAAAELKLDPESFGKCLDGKVFSGQVDADLKLAESLGITGTPAFLVNGRFIEGAQPFEAFQEVIEDELTRLPAPPAAK